MQFEIGSDLGIVLFKGVVLSFLSVMIFLPALALFTYQLLDRTKHRALLPEFKRMGRVVAKVRVPALILVLLLLVPSYLARAKNDSPTLRQPRHSTRSGVDKETINRCSANHRHRAALPGADAGQEQLLSAYLKELPNVTGVISFAVARGLRSRPNFSTRRDRHVIHDINSRIIVYTTQDEGDAAFSTVEQVQGKARDYYGEGVLSCGQSVTMYDMKNVVQNDNRLVNTIAVIAILLVLLVTFRSLTLPVILIVTIETAIWLNLILPYFTGSPLCISVT